MPRGNGTGPAGMGPMTGRAAGYCAGYQMPGFMNPIGGRGGFWGRGRGFWGRGGGRGWRNRYYATGVPGWAVAPYGNPAWGPVAGNITPEQELAGLKDQAQYFQDALDEISKRIDELEKAQQQK
ncbi:MAG: DUF5320 domain-containing protein [Sedimentisphaerales bacterium]|nr:DUF5320 domain-containing protein [Sedimentisphaerales bacterium]